MSLELAVRGMLVRRDSVEAFASLALEPSGLDAYELPPGWRIPKLEDLLSEDTRNGYSRRPDDAPDGVPILRISAGTARSDGVVAEEEHKLIGAVDDTAREQYGLRKGDLLACRFNGNKAYVGRLSLFEDYLDLRPIFPDKLIRVRVDDALASVRYIRAIASSALVRGWIEELCATTVGNWGISASNLKQVRIPLPPLYEQHRIVAKVDELMALCDQLEAARKEREAARDRLAAASLTRLNAPDPDTFQADARFALNVLPALSARPDQLKQLRQTILNLAVRGKLAAQESGESLDSFPVELLETLGEELPSTWGWVKLEHLLAEETRNGYSRKPDDAPDGVPILRISAGTVRRDGIVAEEEHKLISGIDEVTRQQYGIYAGDLLACRFNGNKAFVGRLTLFTDYLKVRPIYPDKLIRVRVNKRLALPAYVRLAADSDLVRAEVERLCATTVGNWGISASNLKAVRIPLPPLAEQRRVVNRVNALMSLCEQLETSLSSGEAARNSLLDALLNDALRHRGDGVVHAPTSAESPRTANRPAGRKRTTRNR